MRIFNISYFEVFSPTFYVNKYSCNMYEYTVIVNAKFVKEQLSSFKEILNKVNIKRTPFNFNSIEEAKEYVDSLLDKVCRAGKLKVFI